jgi:hypothetical protein
MKAMRDNGRSRNKRAAGWAASGLGSQGIDRNTVRRRLPVVPSGTVHVGFVSTAALSSNACCHNPNERSAADSSAVRPKPQVQAALRRGLFAFLALYVV